jgi:hypothetical protein
MKYVRRPLGCDARPLRAFPCGLASGIDKSSCAASRLAFDQWRDCVPKRHADDRADCAADRRMARQRAKRLAGLTARHDTRQRARSTAGLIVAFWIGGHLFAQNLFYG